MERFCFSNWTWLFFLNIGFDVFDNSSGIFFVIINVCKFFLFKISDILAGIFVNFFDIILEEMVFGLFDSIVFDGIMSIEPNGSISNAGSTATHFWIDVFNKL